MTNALASELKDPNLTEKKAEQCSFNLQHLSSPIILSKHIFLEQDIEKLKQNFRNLMIILDNLDRMQRERRMNEIDQIKIADQDKLQIAQPTLFHRVCDQFERNFME